MRINAGPREALSIDGTFDAHATLFDAAGPETSTSVGRAIAQHLRRRRLDPPSEAWDFLAIALAAKAADGMVPRATSPDGWTREFDLTLALQQPDRWAVVEKSLSEALNFLTTDRWRLTVRGGGYEAQLPTKPRFLAGDSALLLSGGLDSLVGAIDVISSGRHPVAVSKTVRGDGRTQRKFAREVSETELEHLQLNDNASTRRAVKETSQRSRSMLFIALGVFGATMTEAYAGGATVPLYICENGFIAMNPPLTGARIGSLSTRTTHPEFLRQIQTVFDVVGLRVAIQNPYINKTKGEMLVECSDQDLLTRLAPESTSCGRFQRFGYTHCGRCVPCQIRRAAFVRWDHDDPTEYKYSNLALPDSDHRDFKDVRAVQMARTSIDMSGFGAWLGPALLTPATIGSPDLEKMLARGISELTALHYSLGLT